MKIFLASLATETNTFSPFRTGHRTFSEGYLVRNGHHSASPQMFAAPLVLWRSLASEHGWSVNESLCAYAQPSGLTLRHVYESYRDEILKDLKQAMPVDAILLSLHGAMVAEDYDDCEGDLLASIRSLVGPTVPVGVELDLHCHLTDQMVENATAIVLFKEYPHIDFAERATELFHIIFNCVEGRIRPVMSLYDCKMVGIFHTTRKPMKSYLAEITRLEKSKEILSISLAHGFPWGDVSDMGTRVLVVTDDYKAMGTALSEFLGQLIFELRHQLTPPYVNIEVALEEALSTNSGPVVLADVADNPGGGAPGDSTFILRGLLDRGIQDAALGCIWDPIAVAVSSEAGEGAQLDLRLGGKMGPSSGLPLDLHVTVTKVVPSAIQTFGPSTNPSISPLGDAVSLNCQGIDIIVNSIRTQVLGIDAFFNLAIAAKAKRILVVKSMQHFYASFAPFAKKILYVDTPGTLISDFTQIPYQRVDRQKWPWSKI